MKKLMIAASAALCATVGFSAVESSNIVGYSAVTDGGNTSPGIGSIFCPVNLGSTYKLSDIVVSGAAADEFMVPGAEYLQKLNPATTAVAARYTYVSEAFLKDEFEDEWESYKSAIGWWLWQKNTNYAALIEDGNYSLKLSDSPDIDVGTAFLGALNGNELKFTSSGEVPSVATEVSDNGYTSPFFLNYLPKQINLADIVVEGADDDEFMVPGGEYLQVLSPSDTHVTARYTYVSEAFLKDEFEDDWADYASAIGWWNWQKNTNYATLIENGDYTLKCGTVPLAPGFSFLGALNGNGLKFKFPAAISNN